MKRIFHYALPFCIVINLNAASPTQSDRPVGFFDADGQQIEVGDTVYLNDGQRRHEDKLTVVGCVIDELTIPMPDGKPSTTHYFRVKTRPKTPRCANVSCEATNCSDHYFTLIAYLASDLIKVDE